MGFLIMRRRSRLGDAATDVSNLPLIGPYTSPSGQIRFNNALYGPLVTQPPAGQLLPGITNQNLLLLALATVFAVVVVSKA